jgi:hypothetical protein
MFSSAKVGDRVWDVHKGWGTITCIDNSLYPIYVNFDDTAFNGSTHRYTDKGYYREGYINPSLFWDEVKLTTPSKPKAKYKLVNGVRIPSISITPKLGSYYYYPYVSNGIADVSKCHFVKDKDDQAREVSGLCYPYTDEGKVAALLHAEAMLKYELVEE